MSLGTSGTSGFVSSCVVFYLQVGHVMFTCITELGSSRYLLVSAFVAVLLVLIIDVMQMMIIAARIHKPTATVLLKEID